MHVIGRPRPSFRLILYLMIFGVSLRLSILTNLAPVPLDAVFWPGTYDAWLAIGLTSPPLALLAWWLIHRSLGIWRYRGLWFRLASDTGALTVVFSYHLATVLSNPVTEVRLFSRYMVGACLIYLIGLIVVDLAALIRTERIVRRG